MSSQKALADAAKYTVGWIAPLPIERAAAEALLDEEHGKPLNFDQRPSDKLSYSWGSVGEHNVVIASLKAGQYGLVSAAEVAGAMLSSFPEIRFGLLVGIGGGIPRMENGGEVDIRLGDVVVSEPSGASGGVIQYDLVKDKAGGHRERKDFLNSPPEVLLYALSNLKSKHERRGSQIPEILSQMEIREALMFSRRPGNPGFGYQGQENDRLFKAAYTHKTGPNCGNCLDSEEVKREPRPSTEPAVHYGLIASGNILVKDAVVREQLLEHIPDDCICYEMEAAGLMNSFPCLVIRGICDYADTHKNDRWQRHAAATAVAFAKELLSYVPVLELRQTPKAIDKIGRDVDQILDTANNIRTKIEQHQRISQDREILDWLSPNDYALQQSDFIRRRQKETGQWLLDSKEFRDWLDSSNQTLFCPGMPGAGKTMITSIVIQYLHDKFQYEPMVGVAYVYCNFRRGQEQKPEDLLASLLKQLIQERNDIPQSVVDLYNNHKRQRMRPSFEELTKTLHLTLYGYSRNFIILDALDECQVSDNGRLNFLSAVFEIQAQTGANIFATSRHIPDIEKHFAESTKLEIHASAEDVKKYVHNHMSQLPSFVSSRPDLQEKIKDAIINAVDGMFLLAQLHLESLSGAMRPRDLETALQKLPSGSDAYDHAYKEAMERIQSQVSGRQKLAVQVLYWITCAERPLTALELRHALAVDIGSSKLDEDKLPEVQDLVSICAGLVTVDDDSNIIRLVHYTTQEYFERNLELFFPNCQTTIGEVCVTYLSFDTFRAGSCPNSYDFKERLRYNPLYYYAAWNWGHHVRKSPSQAVRMVYTLLADQEKVAAATQAIRVPTKLDPTWEIRIEYPRAQHLAAYFGLNDVIEHLLDNGVQLEERDSLGRTLLQYAAKIGRARIVEILVRKGADINAKGSFFGNALQTASSQGHVQIVQRLLEEGADVNAQDSPFGNALQAASLSGHVQIVQMLLEKGANINAQGSHFGNALQAASYSGESETVQRLLDEGADINAQGGEFGNALQAALDRGHHQVVQMLLCLTKAPRAGGKYGNSPIDRCRN